MIIVFMPYRPKYSDEELRYLQKVVEGFSSCFGLLAQHLVITDKDAHILFANRAAQEITGYTFEEMFGKNPADLWGGHMSQEMYEEMWDTIKNKKKSYAAEVENKRKDGTTYWQALYITPVLDEEGEVKFFIAIEPDITIRREGELKKTERVEELERFQKMLIGRELRMIELKERIRELEKKLQSVSP